MIKCILCNQQQGAYDCGVTEIGQPTDNFFKHKNKWYCGSCLLNLLESQIEGRRKYRHIQLIEFAH